MQLYILPQVPIVPFIWWENQFSLFPPYKMKIWKMILSFGKRYPEHVICKASLYLHLPESFCIFIACRSLPYDWVLWKDCNCGRPQKLSNLTHCVSLGPALLLGGYKLCLADPDLSALLDWKEMAPLLRFSPTQHLIWCWTDQRMHGESHFPAESTIQVMFMQFGIQCD